MTLKKWTIFIIMYLAIQGTWIYWWIVVQVHQSFLIRLHVRINLILEKLPRIRGSQWLDRFQHRAKQKKNIKLPEFNWMVHIFASFHVATKRRNNNVIFGRALLMELGINLDFQNSLVGWKETKISMKSINSKMRTNFAILESKNIWAATNRIKKFNMLNMKRQI